MSERSDATEYVRGSISGSTARNSARLSIGRANSSTKKQPIDFDAGASVPANAASLGDTFPDKSRDCEKRSPTVTFAGIAVAPSGSWTARVSDATRFSFARTYATTVGSF
jgi:hypothetical protein